MKKFYGVIFIKLLLEMCLRKSPRNLANSTLLIWTLQLRVKIFCPENQSNNLVLNTNSLELENI